MKKDTVKNKKHTQSKKTSKKALKTTFTKPTKKKTTTFTHIKSIETNQSTFKSTNIQPIIKQKNNSLIKTPVVVKTTQMENNFLVYLVIFVLSVFAYSIFLFFFKVINFNGWIFASFVLHGIFLSVFVFKKINYSGNVLFAIVVGLLCSVLLYVYSAVEFIPVVAHFPIEVNVVQLLLIGFLFPFAEEVFFREGIQKSLSSSIGLASVPITALLGSLLHLPKLLFFAFPIFPFLVLFFFLNLFWSAMYDVRKSVEETTIAHAVYNVMVVLFF